MVSCPVVNLVGRCERVIATDINAGCGPRDSPSCHFSSFAGPRIARFPALDQLLVIKMTFVISDPVLNGAFRVGFVLNAACPIINYLFV